jgi:arylsulfatase A-like enzyme
MPSRESPHKPEPAAPPALRPRLARALLLGLLAAALPLAGCRRSAAPPLAVGRPAAADVISAVRGANLVICVLDAARADHLGCYGYPRPTTPNIDRLSRESVVFRQHFTCCPSTCPSTASLLTGLYSDTHRILQRGGLAPGTFTLEQAMKRAGCRTAFFTSNPVASPDTGLGRDFDDVFPGTTPGASPNPPRASDPDRWQKPEGLSEAFDHWLRRNGNSRFFAYLHFLPPHNPYHAPETMKRKFTTRNAPPLRRGRLEFQEAAPPYGNADRFAPPQMANLYDANMLWADWGVGQVVHLLRKRGLLDNTLLIITSDHGEAFGEHGYVFHSHAVYDEFVHIPLLMRFPGRQRLVGSVDALTSTIDLVPTLCDLYGVPCPADAVQGASLVPLLEGSQDAVRDHIFSVSLGRSPTYLVRDRDWSLMLFCNGRLRALYDLRADPQQTVNIIADHEQVAAAMAASLEDYAAAQGCTLAELLAPRDWGASEVPQVELRDDVRRQIKALGYLR